MNNVPVIVFGDYIAAYGVMRALGPQKIPIHIVSADGKGLCVHSRYVSKVLVLNPGDPDFTEKLKNWISREIGSEAVLMVAGEDEYLDVLSQNYDSLEPDLKCTFPPWDIVRKVRCKRETYKIADQIGIPTPETIYITSEDELKIILEKGINISFPLLMKSEDSKGFMKKYKTKGIISHNERELLDNYRRYDCFFDQLLLQEMIPGDETQLLNFIGVYNKNSDPVHVFMNRKRRSYRQFSSCTLMETMWSKKVLNYSNDLVKEIGYIGYANPEYKYDTRDGKIKLMEINGRISLSNSHSLCCGTSVIDTMYQDALNGPLAPQQVFARNYPENYLWWMPIDDIVAAIRLFKSGSLKMKDYFRSMVGSGYVIEPFNIKDPIPFIYHILSDIKIFYSYITNKSYSDKN